MAMEIHTYKIVGMIALAGVGLYALHRLGLWMDKKGWLYYRRSGHGSATGNALQELQSIVEPGQRSGAEVRRHLEIKQEDDDSGDPALTQSSEPDTLLSSIQEPRPKDRS